VNPRPALTLLTITLAAALTGCASGSPVTLPSGSPSPDDTLPLRALLSARAAQASAHFFTGSYSLTTGAGMPAQTVTIARSSLGYRLDIASGSTTSVLIHTTAGTFQCSLGGGMPGCSEVAKRGTSLPIALDPRLQHVFTDWPAKLADPSTAITVSVPSIRPTTQGDCFQIDPVSASMDPAVDSGVYCFASNGTVTGVRLANGTLVLTATSPPPATLDLPAPIASPTPGAGSPSSGAPSVGGSVPPIGPTQSPQAE
jgi:hypothetical protein